MTVVVTELYAVEELITLRNINYHCFYLTFKCMLIWTQLQGSSVLNPDNWVFFLVLDTSEMFVSVGQRVLGKVVMIIKMDFGFFH